jgi:hypothetical protein
MSSPQTFSREHDLKRHEKIHASVSLPCGHCDKQYTRDDNLKRHIQLKHPGLSALDDGLKRNPQSKHPGLTMPLPTNRLACFSA